MSLNPNQSLSRAGSSLGVNLQPTAPSLSRAPSALGQSSQQKSQSSTVHLPISQSPSAYGPAGSALGETNHAVGGSLINRASSLQGPQWSPTDEEDDVNSGIPMIQVHEESAEQSNQAGNGTINVPSQRNDPSNLSVALSERERSPSNASSSGGHRKKKKKGTASSSSRPPKILGDAGMPGGSAVPMLKSLSKPPKDKNVVELRIEELDERVLRARLEMLEKELGEYKQKCAYYKKENDWYRVEIESCQKDTADYVRYLESKKAEKESTIKELTELNKSRFDSFMQKKKQKEQENLVKIEELKNLLMELELKLVEKQQELMQLSHVMARRTRHEAEMSRLKKEMQEAESEHQVRVTDLERTLLEARMKLQREADTRIHAMESAAQEKAAKFLDEQTAMLEQENKRLERDLRRIVKETQELLSTKARLEKQNWELEREQQLRDDLVKLRIEKVRDAEERLTKKKQRLRIKNRIQLAKERSAVLEKQREFGRVGHEIEEEPDDPVSAAAAEVLSRLEIGVSDDEEENAV
ncbi:hypothetical protein BJ742DRAFT_892589 [Cladochytrium replicatum]|nr:hypothetical protein BJ742DRAFT_892589 [Cladochytrium replicatum]